MSDERTIEIFDEAVELPPEQRAAFLVRTCGQNSVLLAEVRSLLQAWVDCGAFLESPTPTLPPHLGRYRIERELGRGAMGVVYLATDPELGRPIAIKSLPSGVTQSPRRRETLRREARALAALSHPNVAHLYSLEEVAFPEAGDPSDGRQDASAVFLTMEYVPGRPLADEMRTGPMELERALDLGRQICSALEAAHRQGIVHRDLGPMNVRITDEGWVKVLDFGLAALLSDGGDDSDPRKMSPLVGTPGYMSPEQIVGGDIDVRVDTWAFGCVLFECLVGTPAIRGRSLRDILEATRENQIAWDRIPDTVPPPVTEALKLCLQGDIEERPRDLGDIRLVLDEELLRIRSAPFVRRRRSNLRRSGRGNLPRNANRFVGRTEVLDQLVTLIAEHSLVTITGPGGTGKSRTVLELGAQVREQFPDGTWWVEFSELTDPSRIVATIARSLALEESAGENLASLSTALEERASLLLFDNCEHFVSALAPIVSHLLAENANLSIIATSREPLGIPEEQSFALSTLETAPVDAEIAYIRETESVQLFLARARSRDPNFDPGPEDTVHISEICRALDGLPLAIEMAAGHARTVSLQELHRWVHDDPRFLAQRGPGTADRHRSLEDMIDWSYRLLDAEEQSFFEDLAIFRGGWSLAAAESMAENDSVDVWKVRDLLEQLVEKSLVEVEWVGRLLRYRFLETVRQFAVHRQRKHRGAETPERRQRFISFYMDETRPRAAEAGRNSVAWLRRTRSDFANILAAFEMSLQDDRLDQAMPLGSAIGRCSNQDGQWREGRELLYELIDLDRARQHSGKDPSGVVPLHRVEVFAFAAEASVMLDGFEEADTLIEEGLTLLDEAPSDEAGSSPVHLEAAQARMLDAAGSVAYYEERLNDSFDLKKRAEVVYRQLENRGGLAAVLADIGRIYSVDGKHEEAQPYYHEALTLSRELGDEISAARLLVNLARTGQMTGRSEDTLSQLREALTLLRQGGDMAALAQCLHALGDASQTLEDDLDASRGFLAETLELRIRAGLFRATAAALLDFAALELRAGNEREASEYIAGLEEGHRTRHAEIHTGLLETLQRMKDGVAQRLSAEEIAAARSRGQRLGFRALVDRAIATVGALNRPTSSESNSWGEL